MADVVRGLVTGDPQHVNIKYQAPVVTQAFYRLVMTANNSGGLIGLYKNYDLEASDRAAIAERIVFIEAHEAARAYLAKLGGFGYTARPGHRWIAGPSGESDFIVARHFRYLYENRGKPTGNRLLVPGYFPPQLAVDMAVNSGTAPSAVLCLLEMLRNIDLAGGEDKGVYVDEDTNEVYVTTKAVLDTWLDVLHLPNVPSLTKLGAVLTSLSDGQLHRVRVSGSRSRCHKIDMSLVLGQAEKHGFEVPPRFLDPESRR